MVFFPNQNLELFEYTETDEVNSYLEPKHEYVYTTTIPCDFQSMTPNESIKEFGEIKEDTYKIYVDLNAPVTSSMILRIEGEPDTYEITGTVINNNHLLPVQHKKIVVQKQRKPTCVVKEETTEPTEPIDTTETTDGEVSP